jgi:hypothetical protein
MKNENKLAWLNMGNQAASIQMALAEEILESFPNTKLIHLEVGSAYGGGVEAMAKLWSYRGLVYGYDTFEGHPKDLADDPKSHEAICMDMWYDDPQFGRKKLAYSYQRKALDEEGLTNAILVKGRINEHSFDDIKEFHMALLDLDLIKPTVIAYNALKDKAVTGGYLLFHDALPEDHLPLIHKFVYNEVLKDPNWIVKGEYPHAYLTILKRV